MRPTSAFACYVHLVSPRQLARASTERGLIYEASQLLWGVGLVITDGFTFSIKPAIKQLSLSLDLAFTRGFDGLVAVAGCRLDDGQQRSFTLLTSTGDKGGQPAFESSTKLWVWHGLGSHAWAAAFLDDAGRTQLSVVMWQLVSAIFVGLFVAVASLILGRVRVGAKSAPSAGPLGKSCTPLLPRDGGSGCNCPPDAALCVCTRTHCPMARIPCVC